MPEIVIERNETRPARGPRVGLLTVCGIAVVAAMFGGLIAWSSLAPLESAAVAPGTVSVEFDRKTIKHLEGGIVRRILVAEGDKVREGQTLIELDDTQTRAQLELLTGRRAEATARFARLSAERDGAERTAYPDWLQQLRGSPKIDEIIARQDGIFAARREAMASQIAIRTKRIGQLEEEIKGHRGNIESTRAALSYLGEELADMETLVGKGLARKPRLLELKRMRAEREGELSKAISALARAQQRIGETQLEIHDLSAARNADITEELRKVQSELLETEERLRVAEDAVRRSKIVSPLDGTVVGLQVHTVGGVVGAAEPLVHIVPSKDRLIIEAQVSPSDIDVVRAGLDARVVLTPYNARRSSSIAGKVVSVSADSLHDEKSGRSYYLARIELHNDHHLPGRQVSLYPGMPAQVMIITGKHTMIEYLVEPITRNFNVAFRED